MVIFVAKARLMSCQQPQNIARCLGVGRVAPWRYIAMIMIITTTTITVTTITITPNRRQSRSPHVFGIYVDCGLRRCWYGDYGWYFGLFCRLAAHGLFRGCVVACLGFGGGGVLGIWIFGLSWGGWHCLFGCHFVVGICGQQT